MAGKTVSQVVASKTQAKPAPAKRKAAPAPEPAPEPAPVKAQPKPFADAEAKRKLWREVVDKAGATEQPAKSRVNRLVHAALDTPADRKFAEAIAKFVIAYKG